MGSCTGEGVVAKDVITILDDEWNDVMNMPRFHNLLGDCIKDFEHLSTQYGNGTINLTDFLRKIVLTWVHSKGTDATIGVLRKALGRDSLPLSGKFETFEYLRTYHRHICDKCVVTPGNTTIPKEIQLHNNSNDTKVQKVVATFQSKLLSEYKVKGLLGSGSFGAVLECVKRTDKKIGGLKLTANPTAVKLMPGNDPEAAIELDNMMKIKEHANLVRYRNFWTDQLLENEVITIKKKLSELGINEKIEVLDKVLLIPEPNLLCIEMELCENDLRKWIWKQSQKNTKTEEAIHVFSQILSGIDHIHTEGFMHRDVKPENVFMDKNVAKIGDFGLIMKIDGDNFKMEDSARGIYKPEDQFGEWYDKSVDTYAAGLILFDLLYRDIAINSKNPGSIIKHKEAFTHLKQDEELPHAFHEKYQNESAEYAAIILEMISRKPEKRPKILDVKQRLDSITNKEKTRKIVDMAWLGNKKGGSAMKKEKEGGSKIDQAEQDLSAETGKKDKVKKPETKEVTAKEQTDKKIPKSKEEKDKSVFRRSVKVVKKTTADVFNAITGGNDDTDGNDNMRIKCSECGTAKSRGNVYKCSVCFFRFLCDDCWKKDVQHTKEHPFFKVDAEDAAKSNVSVDENKNEESDSKVEPVIENEEKKA